MSRYNGRDTRRACHEALPLNLAPFIEQFRAIGGFSPRHLSDGWWI
jgi:hypothetical protein